MALKEDCQAHLSRSLAAHISAHMGAEWEQIGCQCPGSTQQARGVVRHMLGGRVDAGSHHSAFWRVDAPTDRMMSSGSDEG